MLVLLAGCGASDSSGRGNGPAASGLRWQRSKHLRDVVDLTGARRDGRLTVTTSRRLFLLRPGGSLTPFARGPGGYRAVAGDEPYIALSPPRRANGGCPHGPGGRLPPRPREPPSLGSAGGALIAPDENSGHVIAIDPRGVARTIADSGLPTGGDIGIESSGFVPPGLGPTGRAYLADRAVPGNPHPGTGSILA